MTALALAGDVLALAEAEPPADEPEVAQPTVATVSSSRAARMGFLMLVHERWVRGAHGAPDGQTRGPAARSAPASSTVDAPRAHRAPPGVCMRYSPGEPDDVEEWMTRVALLGTGLLGSAFADALLSRRGTELTVWNRTRAKAEPLAAMGARVADSPADAVQGAERVHLVLFDDATVDETIAALRLGHGSRAVVIDHTTTLPAATATRAKRLASENVQFLHAPVFMSPAAARSAQGMMLVAGDSRIFAKVRDNLERMTGEVWHVGERPDLAAAYKLFGNAMLVAMGAGLADIFHMADALDISRADALGVFDRFRIEGGIRNRGTKIVDQDFTPSFHLETARKDVRLMIDSAGKEPVPVLRAVAADRKSV